MIEEKYIEQLDSFLNSQFEKKLFKAAIYNLNAEYHPLTFNNFAYAMREVIRHMLHRVAPENEIRKCSWFSADSTSKNGITRKQRLRYMIHGGLGDYLIKKMELKEIIDDACNDLLSKHKTLDAFTHIEPETFDISINESKKMALECVISVIEIFSIIENIKNFVFEKIGDNVDNELLESTIFQSCEDIESLARVAVIEDLYTTGFQEIKILSNRVVFTVNGTASCYFEYGSRSEWRNGDGVTLNPSFPFQAQVTVMITPPFGKEISVQGISIDTQSWYE